MLQKQLTILWNAKYSWFSLFVVAGSIKLQWELNKQYWTSRKYRVRFLQASGHAFSSTDQYMTLN